jgi:Rrf2 family cysteine metabolism transcriptional repressor
MQISTRARYGFRALMELASRYGQGAVPLKEVAKCQGISVKYLEQLFTRLRAAGLVRGVRGTGGGYVLARPPAQISLAEAFNVLEGSLAMVECVDEPETCDQSAACVTRGLWTELKEANEHILASQTLQDLADRQLAHVGGRAGMYEI